MTLSKKRIAFVSEYLKCFNATLAAKQAGYAGNDNTLSSIGYNLLRIVDISEAIKRHLQKNAMSADEVLYRIAAIARGDVGDFAEIRTADDLVKYPHSFIIKRFKRTITTSKDGVTTENIELELYDSLRALELLARAHGLFSTTVEMPVNINITGIDDRLKIAYDKEH